MAAKSNSVFDVLEWVCDVLASCKTEEQQESAKKLVLLYLTGFIHYNLKNNIKIDVSHLPLTEDGWVSTKYPYITEHSVDWELFGGLKLF